MKRFFVMIFTFFLVAFLSSSFTDTKTTLDNDVGYSLTIDQNEATVNLVSPATDMQIARGVSVPDKGLSYETYNFIIEKQISGDNGIVCNLGLRSLSQTSTIINNKPNRTCVNQYNEGSFRLDIGELLPRQNIV